ncbi:hypothetical protein VitviT2T_028462 [Vitis vinifera]|uniref:Pectinesterase inhibitor domain-containing protein n=1 Tax=Vitis vinifera TaxID=29760 RepID=A5BYP8_VITVI|nr:hypothetical protein VitviT2T_028462 [Vitis vinifera]CAN75133.1 hypothetical protein VITISV_024975 [Vitis vinifera]
MNSLIPLLLFLTIFLFFFLFFPPSSSPTTSTVAATYSTSTFPNQISLKLVQKELIQKVCSKTSNRTFCVETLESDPRTPSAYNLPSLARIAIELSIANVSDTQALIASKLRGDTTDPDVKHTLKWCVTWYTEVIALLRSAVTALEVDIKSAHQNIYTAGEYMGYCESNMDYGGVLDSWILTGNQFSDYLLDIAFFSTIEGL